MNQIRLGSLNQHGCWSSVGLILLVVLFSGCSRTVRPDSDVVAKIGSREIRKSEFEAWLQRRASGNDPKEKTALLNEMLDHLALVEHAKGLGLDRDPDLLRSWDNMLVAKLREVQLEPQLTNIQPTEAQIRSHYESNQAGFTEPAIRRGAILFTELPAKVSPDERSRLHQRLVEARARAVAPSTNGPAVRGFGPLAVEYSEDQATRYRGGDFGWVRAGRGDARFDREVIDQLFALSQPGDISDILETKRGFYLVKLMESQSERVKPLAAVKEAIRYQLLQQNRSLAETRWKQAARAAVPTEIRPEVLASISVPQASSLSTNPPSLP